MPKDRSFRDRRGTSNAPQNGEARVDANDRVLYVPQWDMAKAEMAMRKADVTSAVSNLCGAENRVTNGRRWVTNRRRLFSGRRTSLRPEISRRRRAPGNWIWRSRRSSYRRLRVRSWLSLSTWPMHEIGVVAPIPMPRARRKASSSATRTQSSRYRYCRPRRRQFHPEPAEREIDFVVKTTMSRGGFCKKRAASATAWPLSL